MTTAPATLPPVACRPWCTEGTGHTNAENSAEQLCLAEDHYLELSQHHDMGAYGVAQAEATVSLVHVHDGGQTTVDLVTPERVTTLTLDEARDLHAALGHMIALAEGKPGGEDVMVGD